MSAFVHVNDIGTALRFTVKNQDGDVFDLSGYSSIVIYLQTPSATVLTKTATLVTDGTDGKLQYVTLNGDISEAGTWRAQVKVEKGGGSWKSEVVKFKVKANL